MSLNGTVWHPIGPSPIDQGALKANGQVTAIAVNPNNPSIIYIGTAWGGVWRTHDAGAHWTPILDRAPALGIGEPGAIAIDPVNTSIIFVGTSNRDGSQFSGNATQPPAGLFKSTDGGSTPIPGDSRRSPDRSPSFIAATMAGSSNARPASTSRRSMGAVCKPLSSTTST